jgi:hypothetical protein
LVRLVRIAVHNLAGIPSIVYGIFGLGFFVHGLGGLMIIGSFRNVSRPGSRPMARGHSLGQPDAGVADCARRHRRHGGGHEDHPGSFRSSYALRPQNQTLLRSCCPWLPRGS